MYNIALAMDIHAQLKVIGLRKSEIAVYLYLLQNGLSSPPQIAAGTSIARTNCYNILQSLKEKDLIEEQAAGKRKAYLASDPEAFLRSLERKKEAVERLLPDLRGLYTTQKNKPKITFYDGLEQVKQIYRQSLSAKKVYGLGSTKRLTELMPDFLDSYVRDLQKRGIIFYDLLTPASREKDVLQIKEVLKGAYDAKFFPEKYRDFPTDMLIWDANIALITLQEPIFGTILTNAQMAATFRIIFEVMWERL